MRKCKRDECDVDISDRHKNTKFCSTKCADKYRYSKEGSRLTPERRRFLYSERIKQPGYREKLRKQGNDRAFKVREFLADYKMKTGCVDCGYKEHQAALDFDHIEERGEKSFNLAESKSIDSAIKEIEKCEVVCSNCHRIRTYRRYHEKK